MRRVTALYVYVLCMQHVNATGALTRKAAWVAPGAFGAVLSHYLLEDDAAALAALREIQHVFNELSFPKGLLEATFHNLFDKDVISEEAFVAWKDSVDDTPGKTTALIQLARCGERAAVGVDVGAHVGVARVVIRWGGVCVASRLC
jgi:hypothetical protein